MTVHEVEAPSAPRPFEHAGEGLVVFLGTLCAILCLARAGLDVDGAVDAFVAFVLVRLAAIDVRSRILPNRIVLPAAAAALAGHAAASPPRAAGYAVAAAGAAAAFLVPALLRPGALGMGDVKLALLLGAALGPKVVPALTLGLFAVGVFAAGLVFVRGRSALKTDIPLGPFLAAGALLVLVA